MPETHLIYRKDVHYGLFLFAFLIVIILLILLSVQRAQLDLVEDFNSYRCATNQPVNASTFRILTLTAKGAIEFADEICGSEAMAQVASQVEIHWHPRGFLTAQQIVDQEFDLFWNRQHVVFGLVPDLQTYYMPLLDSASYSLYFASHHRNPRLTTEWFSGKRVGFLSDSYSQSFFLQPVSALDRAGVELEPQGKGYFPDTTALLEAFLQRQVDLISVPEFMLAELDVGPEYQLLINRNMQSGTWFLSQEKADASTRCLMLGFLDEFDELIEHDAAEALERSNCRFIQ